uniref:Secondary ossification center associated regulator of chondrocyte maturation n=1 Tax=Lates calcarifer TaxID=8187 RepID=A0A4W6DLY9_LATCA
MSMLNRSTSGELFFFSDSAETVSDSASTTRDNQDTMSGEPPRVLGPGAITAIVIAVFLGASVLLALIVITLRKFTAS